VATLFVASRPGQRVDDLSAAMPEGLVIAPLPQPDLKANGIELRRCIVRNSSEDMAPLYLLPELEIEISASDIRDQVREAGGDAMPQRALLPGSVSDYILAHGLYR
jgi:nicotinic acid mononucleotide adenylyltransferase